MIIRMVTTIMIIKMYSDHDHLSRPVGHIIGPSVGFWHIRDLESVTCLMMMVVIIVIMVIIVVMVIIVMMIVDLESAACL